MDYIKVGGIKSIFCNFLNMNSYLGVIKLTKAYPPLFILIFRNIRKVKFTIFSFWVIPSIDRLIFFNYLLTFCFCFIWYFFTIRNFFTLAFTREFPTMKRTFNIVANNLAINSQMGTEMETVGI